MLELSKKQFIQQMCFATVLNQKIGLECFVVLQFVLITNIFVDPVEMIHILIINVTECDNDSTVKPPNPTVGFIIPIIEIYC